MNVSLYDLLSQNIAAFFGIAGVLLGGMLALLTSHYTKRQEYKLNLWSKLIEKRINAHEVLLRIACEMRVMCSLGEFDGHGEARRTPRVMLSNDDFNNWFIHFTESTSPIQTWLSLSAKREMHFIQDYIFNIHLKLNKATDSQFVNVGEIIRQDFIDLSSSLEKCAYSYFSKEILQLKMDDLKKGHKYKRAATERRLLETALFLKNAQIKEILSKTIDKESPTAEE